MSGYNPTYTYQWRDYVANRKAVEKYRAKQDKMLAEGVPLWKRVKLDIPKAPLITEERPNPLNMELRIVLFYFWSMYNGCLELAKEGLGAGTGQTEKYEAMAQDTLADVRNVCYDIFGVTSRFHPFHIHSMYGCNDEDCPAWKRGYGAAQENVLDWYSPDQGGCSEQEA